MLNESQKGKFTARAKEEAKKLLQELNISALTDDSIGALQNELVARVSGLVSADEDGKAIDKELLEIYDLLTDIVWDNEEDLNFLNELFLK